MQESLKTFKTIDQIKLHFKISMDNLKINLHNFSRYIHTFTYFLFSFLIALSSLEHYLDKFVSKMIRTIFDRDDDTI